MTYSEVKKIIGENGEIVSLTTNFRSQKPVIDWVNETFGQILPDVADKYSPARCAMIAGQNPDDMEGFGVEVLKIPEECGTNPQVFAYEPDVVAQVIHNAVAPKSKTTPPAKPGDFMIIAAPRRTCQDTLKGCRSLASPRRSRAGRCSARFAS